METNWTNTVDNITNITNTFNKDFEVSPWVGHHIVTVGSPDANNGFIRLDLTINGDALAARGVSYKSGRNFREIIPLDANFDTKLTSLIKRKLT